LKEIEVLYLTHEDLIAPTQGYKGDVAYDIYASEGRLVPHSTFNSVVIPTNLRVAFDWEKAGMFASLRSGAACNTPLILSNAPGIIEGTYRGEIGIICRNTFADNSLVDFVFDVKGNKVPLNTVPNAVKKEARKFFEEESVKLGYNNVNEGNAAQVFKKSVPRGTIYVERGTRIAQIFFLDKLAADFKGIDILPDSVRGENGRGSSGVDKK
jgi:dUTPase